MIWFWSILAAVSIGVLLRALAFLHARVLILQEKYQTRFFELADEIIDRDDVTHQQLDELRGLSANVRSRKMQLIVIAAINMAERNKSAPKQSDFKKDMSQELLTLWNKMYFRWLVAVSTQGSVLGLTGLTKLLTYFDPDEPNSLADSLPYIPHPKALGVH
jgi:hypothetical protein